VQHDYKIRTRRRSSSLSFATIRAMAAAKKRGSMTLVTERKVSDFIRPPENSAVLEASGVLVKGAYYYVVFDNIRRIARIHHELRPGSRQHSWFGRRREGDGYEDISFSPYTRHFYLLIEAEKHPDGTYKGLIDECDEEGNYKRRRWIDVSFERRNTGFEGLCAVRWQGRDYLLALCEGNRCRAGRKGKRPGGGRLHVLQRAATTWKSIGCIKLPRSVKFADYSAIALRNSRIAVISQETARLWIGTLRFQDWTIGGEGAVYDFPATKRGKPKYCTLEGLSWLSNTMFVMVSDLSKRDHSKRCSKRDQSIHIFRLSRRQKNRRGNGRVG
jgi:hypothetical protein